MGFYPYKRDPCNLPDGQFGSKIDSALTTHFQIVSSIFNVKGQIKAVFFITY